ncbi:TolC family protein [Rickettsiaceae bacterium]|nr:TolC family protein [Rickettsiaceae bacterium]
MRKVILSSILVFSSATASALTLEQALTTGYNHHEDLKIIRTNFLDEVEQFPRALAGFMPRIYADVASTDSKTDRRSSIQTNFDSITSDTSRYSQSITLEQSLFNGGSSVAELKAAQSGFRASRADYYTKEQEIFLREIDAYLSCVEAKEKYAISKVSVKSNKTQLEAMKEKFRLGESTETEVASAREGVATAESNQAIAYANYEGSKANFYRIFGTEAIGVTMPATPGDMPKTLVELIEKAKVVNPSIGNARHTTKASKAREYASKGALLPRVSFSVTNSRNYYNPQAPNTSQVNNRSVTSTLSMRVPILEKGGIEYSDVRRAKNQTRKSAINLDSAVKQITSSCKANWSAFDAAKLRIKATNQAVKAAEVAYEGMVQEEMLGSKTIVDVLRTEERLNKAREGRVEAKKEMILAAYRIKSLVGELTAKSMKLKVDYFNPEAEFKKMKLKIVGF